jgi:hypothetical protein
MSWTLQKFRDELRDHCGVSDSEWDNTTADSLLNNSFWETQDLFDFREEEATLDIALVAGTSEYSLAVDHEAVESVRILNNYSNDWEPLGFEDDEYFTRNITDSISSRAAPTNYTRRGNKIIFRSTPETAYTVRVHYKKSLGDVLSGGTGLPKAWDEVVFFGAVWRGFAKLGDWNRKAQAKATQAELVGPKKPQKVKELEDTRMAGITFVRRPY